MPTTPPKPRQVAARRRAGSDNRVLLIGGGDAVDGALAERLRAAGRQVVIVSREPVEATPVAGEVRIAADTAGHGWQPWCEACREAVLVLPVPPFDLAGSGRPAAAAGAAARLVDAARGLAIERLVCVSATGAAADAPLAALRAAASAEGLIRGVSGLAWTIVRRSPTFGPGDAFSAPLARIVARFPVVLLPRAERRVQPVAADDVAGAVLEALSAGPVTATVEVGGAEQLAVEELARRTMRALGLRKGVLRLRPGLLEAVLPLTGALGVTALSRDQLAVMLAGSACAEPGKAPASRTRYEGPVWLRAATRPGR